MTKTIILRSQAVRTGNQGRGRVQGLGMTPDERREFLAGKRPANTRTKQRIIHVIPQV